MEDEKKIVEEIEKLVKTLDPGKIKTNGEEKARSLLWKSEAEAKVYLDNLLTEYTFQCYGEKRPDGCYRLANYNETITRNYSEAVKIHKRTCDDSNYERSCYHYANACLLGRGLKKDEIEGFKYHLKSCSLNNGRSCQIAGELAYGGKYIAPDLKLGVKCFEKACDLKEPEACAKLFHINFDEKGQFMNRPKALQYAIKACNLGNLSGCVNASVMYKNGDGIPKDLDLSKLYREKAEEIHKLLTQPQEGIVFGEGHKNYKL